MEDNVALKIFNSLANLFIDLSQQYFASSFNIRCSTRTDESGHDFVRGAMAYMTNDKVMVIHSMCRYCGRINEARIENVMLNPNIFGNAFVEREGPVSESCCQLGRFLQKLNYLD